MANPASHRARRRPFLGQITRGKTAPNRLRKVDIFLLLYAPELIRRQIAGEDTWFVDLGYGADVYTTLESAARLRRLNPNLRVMGVEIDPARVAAAQPFASPQVQFRLGGFNLPLIEGEQASIIRAFNVLRQYQEAEVAGAHAAMAGGLVPGGLIIEGTSDPFGRVWTANLVRKGADGGHFGEALVFGTNFHLGFEPGIFQPVLPKNHIHRMVEGEPIFAFMEAWKAACARQAAQRSFGLRQWFAASARDLAAQGWRLDLRPALLEKGLLVWRG